MNDDRLRDCVQGNTLLFHYVRLPVYVWSVHSLLFHHVRLPVYVWSAHSLLCGLDTIRRMKFWIDAPQHNLCLKCCDHLQHHVWILVAILTSNAVVLHAQDSESESFDDQASE
jgi:hypothetical protein